MSLNQYARQLHDEAVNASHRRRLLARVEKEQIVVVVETEDDRWLGTLRIEPEDTVSVLSGLPGRPAVVPIEKIEKLVLASAHPDVTWES